MRARLRFVAPFVFAVAVVIARLPFLLRGEWIFDSDEAVEGLMARHVLLGEFPVYFWGQGHKGVPEIYISGGLFAVFGSSVILLKAVTLAVFSAYVGLNFVLLRRLYEPGIAVASTLLLIACPPALVLWSLSANAEIAWTLLFGTLLLLSLMTWERTRSRRAEAAFALVVGSAWWIHQSIIYYLLPITLILVLRSEAWRRQRSFRAVRTAVRAERYARPTAVILWLLTTVGLLYVGLSVVAFLTGGLDIRIGSWKVGAHHPQKLAVLGVVVLLVRAAGDLVSNPSRPVALKRLALPAVIFAVGYSPALLYAIFSGSSGPPLGRMNASDLVRALPVLAFDIVPILVGFKSPSAERLPLSSVLACPLVLALFLYVWSRRQAFACIVLARAGRHALPQSFFPAFLLSVPLVFLLTGVYKDLQSYRYLVPVLAGLPVAITIGARAIPHRMRYASPLIIGSVIGVFATQQILWYEALRTDASPTAMIECLEARRIRGGYADYWTSYRLTFLARERLVIAPTSGVDRYPAYSRFVSSLSEISWVYPPQHVSLAAQETFRERVVCGGFVAVIERRENTISRAEAP